MEIDPRTQLQMFLAAFSLGLGGGLLHQTLLALRTVLGAYLPCEHMRPLYERSWPLLRHPLGFSGRGTRRAWCFFVAFFGDVIFCLVCATGLLLLLYDYNYGAWRLSVPVVFLLGFLLFQAGTKRLFAKGNAYLALGLSLLFAYLRALVLLPVHGGIWLMLRYVITPCRSRIKKLYRSHRAHVSARLCGAQLALAERGAISKEGMMSDVKKQDHADAVDH